MLTAHQRIQLSRACLRVEDDLGSTFVAILDHPTQALPFQAPRGARAYWREPIRRDDLDPIELPFVAFRARCWPRIHDDGSSMEWGITTLTSELDDVGVHYIPQLDTRGQEALAFLEEFVAGLE